MLEHGRSQLLTPKTLALAARLLASRDKELAVILASHGDPPLWRRSTGFPTLVKIILEQQVSLRSAAAMFDRLTSSIKPFVPETFIQLGDPYLRKLGVTRQKASYLIHLSASVVDGNLKLSQLKGMSDAEAKLNLMRIKGIGSWSADIYLLMAMRRADIWPTGDLALAIAVKDLKELVRRPGPEELEEISQNWRPHRAVAARMLWQFYLAKKTLAR